jgi:hypothetical protein
LYDFDFKGFRMAVLGGYIKEPEIVVEEQAPSNSRIEEIKAERQRLAAEKKQKQQKTFCCFRYCFPTIGQIT